MSRKSKSFSTSDLVTEGHSDKIGTEISDLAEILRKEVGSD